MKPEIVLAARAEIEEAVAYYDGQREGLGLEFMKEVEEAIARIVENPRAWPRFSHRSRRHRTKRFPYGIGYQIKGETIEIEAVMDLRRDPRAWRIRLEEEDRTRPPPLDPSRRE